MTPRARQQVLAVLADILGEQHPGTRWQPVQRDGAQPAATLPAGREIGGGHAGPQPQPRAKRGCVTDPLYHHARRLIAQLELVSHAPARAYDSDGRSTGDPSRPPTTGHHRAPPGPGPRELDDREPAFLPLRRRLRKASTARELRSIIIHAERELRIATRTVAPPIPEKGSIAWRRAIANDDRPAGEVARIYDCTRQHVYTLRTKYRDETAQPMTSDRPV